MSLQIFPASNSNLYHCVKDWYTWTRDAGLVFKAVAERFSVSFDEGLQGTLQDYVASQAFLQTVSNPSGSFSDGSGLAEPKFNTDMTQFTGAWGRPQRDGPALRAIAIMAYAKWLIANGYPETAAEVTWPVIRNDLAYVAQYWYVRLPGRHLYETWLT